jgi:hypothetical protein
MFKFFKRKKQKEKLELVSIEEALEVLRSPILRTLDRVKEICKVSDGVAVIYEAPDGTIEDCVINLVDVNYVTAMSVGQYIVTDLHHSTNLRAIVVIDIMKKEIVYSSEFKTKSKPNEFETLRLPIESHVEFKEYTKINPYYPAELLHLDVYDNVLVKGVSDTGILVDVLDVDNLELTGLFIHNDDLEKYAITHKPPSYELMNFLQYCYTNVTEICYRDGDDFVLPMFKRKENKC